MMGFLFPLIPSQGTFAVDLPESDWTRLLDDGKALTYVGGP
jgi:hypothetical protein